MSTTAIDSTLFPSLVDADSNRDGTFELHRDVSSSPLWNRDLAPTKISERTWSAWNFAALWIGMCVVLTTYKLTGGMISVGMKWWQALMTVSLGNIIVLIPMLLNAHPGAKYGVCFPVLCRASFGTRGANIAAIMRAIVACGWFGIQTWIAGMAIDKCILVFYPDWANIGSRDLFQTGYATHTWIAFGLVWAIQVGFIIRGIKGIKILETVSAPLLLAGGVGLLFWATHKAGGMVVTLQKATELKRDYQQFWVIFPPALTASTAYWATLATNIPDFSRFAKSQKSQVWGQILGLPTTMTLFSFIGIAVTAATLVFNNGQAIYDPTDLLPLFGNLAVVLFATVVIFGAQLTTNLAANVVAPSNDFSNLAPRRISYISGGLITAVIGVAMMPWELLRNWETYAYLWLNGYSTLMGALAAILIVDYWILRRRHLDLNALFDPNGKYSYTFGFNPRAIVALVVAIGPVVPGFLNALASPRGVPYSPGYLDVIYTYAWFVTFGIAGIVYYLLMAHHPNVREDAKS